MTHKFFAISYATLICVYPSLAQEYPSKPIRLVTSGMGGGTDLVSRFLSQALPTTLGQQLIVDNRANSVIAGDIVAKAPADGYTLLVGSSSHWLAPFLQDNVPWDPIRDFAPITLTTRSPNVLVVHPSVKANSVKELIALAKSSPSELNYSSALTGGSTHLSAELFKVMTGVDIVRIAYKGSAPAFTDLVAGRTQLMFATIGQVKQTANAGRIKALAITTAKPSPLYVGLPTIAETVAGYESTSFFGVFAPARTPQSVINRLNHDMVQVLRSTDLKERFAALGVETVGSTPSELATAVKSEMHSMGKVIKDGGIKAE